MFELHPGAAVRGAFLPPNPPSKEIRDGYQDADAEDAAQGHADAPTGAGQGAGDAEGHADEAQALSTSAAAGALSVGLQRLRREVEKLPQYEPQTDHFFHGGMYCRRVRRDAGVLVIGKVHKKEHFYLVASGSVLVSDGALTQRYAAPALILSHPGTQRAVYSETAALCFTFHRTDATTVEDAEAELVDDDAASPFGVGNVLRVAQPNCLESAA